MGGACSEGSHNLVLLVGGQVLDRKGTSCELVVLVDVEEEGFVST